MTYYVPSGTLNPTLTHPPSTCTTTNDSNMKHAQYLFVLTIFDATIKHLFDDAFKSAVHWHWFVITVRIGNAQFHVLINALGCNMLNASLSNSPAINRVPTLLLRNSSRTFHETQNVFSTMLYTADVLVNLLYMASSTANTTDPSALSTKMQYPHALHTERQNISKFIANLFQ